VRNALAAAIAAVNAKQAEVLYIGIGRAYVEQYKSEIQRLSALVCKDIDGRVDVAKLAKALKTEAGGKTIQQRVEERTADGIGECKNVIYMGVLQGKTAPAVMNEIQTALAKMVDNMCMDVDHYGNKVINEAVSHAFEIGIEIMGDSIRKGWKWYPGRKGGVREDHVAMDKVLADDDGLFTFPDGIQTTGPGQSGYPEHDCYCCCRLVMVNVDANGNVIDELEGEAEYDTRWVDAEEREKFERAGGVDPFDFYRGSGDTETVKNLQAAADELAKKYKTPVDTLDAAKKTHTFNAYAKGGMIGVGAGIIKYIERNEHYRYNEKQVQANIALQKKQVSAGLPRTGLHHSVCYFKDQRERERVIIAHEFGHVMYNKHTAVFDEFFKKRPDWGNKYLITERITENSRPVKTEFIAECMVFMECGLKELVPDGIRNIFEGFKK